MAKKKGLISRLIEGPERSESYARSKLPTNRWQLGWDVFKTNFSKLVLINLLTLVFAIPLVLIILMRNAYIATQAASFPFSQNIGLGYPSIGNMSGLAENITVVANWSTLIYLPVVALILAVGLSGSLYITRNLVWTEGVFVGSDFWRGVKKNYLVVMLTLLLYSLFFLFSTMSISMCDYMLKTSTVSPFLLTAAKILSYTAIVIISITALFMLTLGVTYELKFFKLIRNAFLLTLALIPTNIFFLLLAAIPFILAALLGGIGYILICIFGVSYAVLVWTTYSQWIFDKFINDKVPGAKKNRGIYEKVDSHGNPLYPTEGFDETQFDTAYLNKRPIKPITDYEIDLVELPQTFSREDLRRLEESKEAMRRDSDEYVAERLKENEKEFLSDNAETDNGKQNKSAEKNNKKKAAESDDNDGADK